MNFNLFQLNELGFSKPFLVGGFNPSEKYARQNGFIFPNFRGENKQCLSCHHLVFPWKETKREIHNDDSRSADSRRCVALPAPGSGPYVAPPRRHEHKTPGQPTWFLAFGNWNDMPFFFPVETKM